MRLLGPGMPLSPCAEREDYLSRVPFSLLEAARDFIADHSSAQKRYLESVSQAFFLYLRSIVQLFRGPVSVRVGRAERSDEEDSPRSRSKGADTDVGRRA